MVQDSYDLTKRKDHREGTYVPKDIPADSVLEEVISRFPSAEKVERKGRRAEVRIAPEIVSETLSIFRKNGYDHFVALTCIDFPDERRMGLVYHLFSYGSRVHIYVKTFIDRENPAINSVVDVFRPAITYEREIKEMFGVDFPGNPRLTDFILEDWSGPPPMRKDFDSIQYVQETFDIKVRHPRALPPKPKKGGDA
jgi:NADH-quinone oxidoreductase subunit C